MWQDERLKELISYGIKGLIIGLPIGLFCGGVMGYVIIANGDILGGLYAGFSFFIIGTWFFGCIPYGWNRVNKIVGGWAILSTPLIMFFAIATKVCFAVCVGAALYPSALIRTIIKIKFFENRA